MNLKPLGASLVMVAILFSYSEGNASLMTCDQMSLGRSGLPGMPMSWREDLSLSVPSASSDEERELERVFQAFDRNLKSRSTSERAFRDLQIYLRERGINSTLQEDQSAQAPGHFHLVVHPSDYSWQGRLARSLGNSFVKGELSVVATKSARDGFCAYLPALRNDVARIDLDVANVTFPSKPMVAEHELFHHFQETLRGLRSENGAPDHSYFANSKFRKNSMIGVYFRENGFYNIEEAGAYFFESVRYRDRFDAGERMFGPNQRDMTELTLNRRIRDRLDVALEFAEYSDQIYEILRKRLSSGPIQYAESPWDPEDICLPVRDGYLCIPKNSAGSSEELKSEIERGYQWNHSYLEAIRRELNLQDTRKLNP